jgi:DNA-binding transcriptional ArsR family regulator
MASAAPARPLEVVRRRDVAVTLLQPLRQEILETLEEPDSASGVARRLGLPRQKVNYHLRELEKGGLVELVEERRRGNCNERVVRAVARSYLISPEALGGLGSRPEQIQDRFSAAYLVATAGQAIRDVGEMQEGARAAGQRLATLTLSSEIRFASADDRNAYAEELAATLARLAAKYHDEEAPEGRRFRFFVGGHPVPKREEESPDARRAGARGMKGER